VVKSPVFRIVWIFSKNQSSFFPIYRKFFAFSSFYENKEVERKNQVRFIHTNNFTVQFFDIQCNKYWLRL
jgi:hypothetical protein